MDVAWFPFDKQRCRLVYESWRYPGSEMNISAEETVVMEQYQINVEWHINSKSSNLIYNNYFRVSNQHELLVGLRGYGVKGSFSKVLFQPANC